MYISSTSDRSHGLTDTYIAGLEFNFDYTDYSIDEGGTLSSFIRLHFRNNQNPFTITFTAASINTTEDLGLGYFINSYQLSTLYRATEGIRKSVNSLQGWHGHARKCAELPKLTEIRII